MNEEIVELRENISDSPLYNKHLAPVPRKERTWNLWSITAIWIGMAVCIPTYILASYMIKSGLNWYTALIIIGLANIIITVPMILNGHAGVKYGIPFPVLGRAAFGYNGIHIPAIIRAIVACGWFGVQTWIGGLSIYAIWNALTGNSSDLSLDAGKFICFFLFWLLNVYFIIKGTESIRWLEDWSAPILIAIGILLIGWGVYETKGFKVVLDQSTQLEKPTAELSIDKTNLNLQQFVLNLNPLKDLNNNYKATHYRIILPTLNPESPEKDMGWKEYNQNSTTLILDNTELDKMGIESGKRIIKVQFKTLNSTLNNNHETPFIYSSILNVGLRSSEKGFWNELWLYILWLTAMVGFWATMSISIADITRYAASQKEQMQGQFLGLPGTMILYSFVGIFVTCASVVIFKDILVGEDAPWDPVTLLSKFNSPLIVIVSQVFLLIATLTTNIAANVIAPSNAFANAFPKKISFRSGGIITALIGILICPWWLLDEISGILIFISGLLGPVVAILICDYFFVHKMNLNLADLYKTSGKYSFGGTGFNRSAMIALSVGVIVALIGYWVSLLKVLYILSWFTGFFVSFIVYYYMMKRSA